MEELKQLKKQNEKLAAMAAKLLPQLREFRKLQNEISRRADKVAEQYDRMAMRAESKGGKDACWQCRQYEAVADKIYSAGDKADTIYQKLCETL
jgi:hypothetical protein